MCSAHRPYPPQSARFTAVTCDSLLSLLIDSWGVDPGRRPAFFLEDAQMETRYPAEKKMRGKFDARPRPAIAAT